MLTDLVAQLQAALGDAYSLDRELAAGGMSRLFLATERSLNRNVVIKVLPPEMTSTVSAARFKREIEVAAHLQHPHIVPVLGAGTNEGLLYYIMPFVHGESLRHRLAREGRLPIGDSVRILREVADALTYAHRIGVVHRDIKPENILIEEGHAVLTDFGIARAILEAGGGERLTGTGMSVGTPGYMSPEQASGESHVDARTDVYALAVVGYEMLAGRPPFIGINAGAVLAAHLRDVPVPLRTVRADTPPPLSAAIAKALAKDPLERFQGAREFRDALTGGAAAAPRARGRLVMGATVGAALIAAGAAVVSARYSKGKDLDQDLIAVAPFDVLGGGLELWKEGMVDVLSRNLDGMGPLRTVSPSVVIKRWSGRADAASAEALGRSSGARLVAFGSLQTLANDSARASIVLRDLGAGRTVAELEVRDLASRVDRIADSLTVGMLRALGRSRPIGAARLASIGSRSLPALKEFLQGEQAFRHTDFDTAAVHYERAVTIDSTFALAYARLGQVAGWARNYEDQQGRAFKLKAATLNRGLAPRDSLLISADSVFSALASPYGDSTTTAQAVQLVRQLERATERYPDDPQVWFALGDARYHLGHVRGVDAGEVETLAAFDRAIAADSSFALAYLHAIELAGEASGPALVRKYVERLLALDPRGTYAASTQVELLLSDTSRVTDATLAVLADTLSAGAGRTIRDVFFWADSSEVVSRYYRALDDSKSWDTPRAAVPASMRAPIRQFMAAIRGHVRRAVQVPSSAAGIPVLLTGARLGLVPRDSARRLVLGWAADTTVPMIIGLWYSPQMQSLPYFAEARDTAAVRIVGDAILARLAARPESSPAVPVMRSNIAALASLARGDSAGALRILDVPPRGRCGRCDLVVNFTYAKLLAARGRNAEALRILRNRGAQLPPVEVGLWALERGRVAEALGERATAITSYGRVVDLWRNADPELQPAVREAREGLKRLGGEDARRRVAAGR